MCSDCRRTDDQLPEGLIPTLAIFFAVFIPILIWASNAEHKARQKGIGHYYQYYQDAPKGYPQ